MKFSDRYRRRARSTRAGDELSPQVRCFGHGGYVYRGKRNPSYYGSYIFGDFESKRIWALTQFDRQLTRVARLANRHRGSLRSASIRMASCFWSDTRDDLPSGAGSIRFCTDPLQARVRLLRNNAPAAARVSIVGTDGKPYARPVPRSARRRATSRISTRMIRST